MNDIVDKAKRSEMMSCIGPRDTRPEMIVRFVAHRMGYRYRLYRRDLPGKPDLVFPRYRLALFVHGCFWHRHPGCHYAATPHTRAAFWQEKFRANVERDTRVQEALVSMGWRVAVIWECETGDASKLVERLCTVLIDEAV